MFKFLKEKISSWLKKSGEEIKKEAKKKAPKAKKSKKGRKAEEKSEKFDNINKLEKEIETESKKIKNKAAENKKERKITEKLIEDIKREVPEIKTPEERLEEIQEIISGEKKEKEDDEDLEEEIEEGLSEKEEPEEKEEKLGFFGRLKKIFSYKLTETEFEKIFSELELLLLENNVALEVVEKLRKDLSEQLIGKEIKKNNIESEIKASLKKALEDIIIEPDNIMDTIKEVKAEKTNLPFKVIFFGINGAGKTTSIAKFANLCLKNKLSVVLAAADTFRAASIEQLQIHADKLQVPLIKHDYNADPSAVAFDAIKYAKTHNIDVVLIDTAGRMHTKENLLHEMEKICRVTNPDLKVFVAEAIAGNDATEQARAFNEMINIDGSILAKTDIDEKGGAILSISYVTKKPILYLGTGQTYNDLALFNKQKFIEQLGLD